MNSLSIVHSHVEGDWTAADQSAGISEWHFSTLFDASLKLAGLLKRVQPFFKTHTHTDHPYTE